MSCPTPHKVKHATKGKALGHMKHLRRREGASVDLLPYHCQCGSWHVGHSQVSLTRRIRRARWRGIA